MYFEDLVNPTSISSIEETEPGDFELVLSSPRWLKSGKDLGVDEIHLEFFNSLDAVRLSWSDPGWSRLTGVVDPLFKKGDCRVCSNYRGITLLSLSVRSIQGFWRGGSHRYSNLEFQHLLPRRTFMAWCCHNHASQWEWFVHDDVQCLSFSWPPFHSVWVY